MPHVDHVVHDFFYYGTASKSTVLCFR